MRVCVKIISFIKIPGREQEEAKQERQVEMLRSDGWTWRVVAAAVGGYPDGDYEDMMMMAVATGQRTRILAAMTCVQFINNFSPP